MFKFNCLEGVVAAGIAGATIVGGHFDPGIAVGGVIGLTAVLARFRENAAESGLDDKQLVDRMRMAAIRDLDRFDDTDAIRAARVDADNLMAELLPKITITRGLLARSSTQSAGHPFPQYAAMRIADEMAVHEPQFARPATGEPLSEHRRFAIHVVTRAIEVAIEETEFCVRLIADLVIEGNRKLAEMDAKLDGQAADTAEIKAIVAATAAEGRARNVSEQTLLALARLIAPGVPDVGTAILELQRALMLYVEQRNRAAPGTNHSDWLSETFRRIAELNSRNKFAEGAAEGERAYEEAIERQNAERLSLIEFNIGQNLLARDADGAARWIERQVQNEHGTVTSTALFEPIERYRNDALRRGLRLEMDVAIALARRAVDLAKGDREKGAAHNLLGLAACDQGDRSDGVAGRALLDEAVAAYRAAEGIWTEAVVPTNWAKTQNNLGNALQVQGERRGGDVGQALLEEAVAAYRAALRVHTENSAPADWAGTQNNLGSALQTQGERSDGSMGLALLDEAIVAYRDALRVYTEDAAPADWAMTQNNLGGALWVQGERSGGAAGLALLHEALEACRAALRVYTEKAAPGQWAVTQNTLGVTLKALGERSQGAASLALLDEAVKTYGAALRVHTKDAVPADWARTRFNMALCHVAMAERSTDPLPHLHEAETSVRDALQVYTLEQMGFHHEKATRLLDHILAEIAKLGG